MLAWQIAVTLFIGFVFGFIVSAAIVPLDGTLKIDVADDKETYMLEVETPLDEVQKRKILHLRIATTMLFEGDSQE